MGSNPTSPTMPGPPKLPDKDFEWTPSLAWIVGLLVTDGCLSNNGKTIILRSSDIQLLRTAKRELNLSNKISTTYNNGWATRPAYRIQFGGVQFYRWLTRIGLFPAKTYTIGAIAIPDEYFRDFLRGHLDGDGSVSGYTDRYNTYKNPKYIYTRIWLRFISASGAHIKWLRSRIVELTEIKGHLWESKKIQPGRTTTMWDLKFGKRESMALLNWMYYDTNLPCLQRKRKKAERLLYKEQLYQSKNLPTRSVGRPRIRYETNPILGTTSQISERVL